jgi:poly [ADP-ribose] polymerase
MTTTTATLIQVNAAGNNNKFYELVTLADGSVRARWGRVGSEGSTTIYPAGSFQKKLNEKLRKGYRVFDGGIAQPDVAVKSQLQNIVGDALFPGQISPAGLKMVKTLVSANRHSIELATGGKITVADSGAVTTALGPVSLSQITTARRLLDTLRQGYDAATVEEYLIFIPQKINNVRKTHWVNAQWCREQADLLDALEAAVALSNANVGPAPTIDFRHTLVEIDNTDPEFARIAAKVDESRNAMHAANKLSLHKVWKIVDGQADKWEATKKELRHTRELWHGSSTGNVLNILKTGLICPSTNARDFNITGRMFGDGVYFSDQSTKSLNYTIGSAPGQRGGASANPMMFLADVVMGRECRSDAMTSGSALVSKSRNGTDEKGRSFNSINVKGGHCGVRNNEMVVWGTDQIRLTHLCEFK